MADTSTITPFLVSRSATNPILRMFSSRSCLLKPRSLQRCWRTTSPSRNSTFKVQRNETNYALRQRFISDSSRLGEDSFAEELTGPYQKWNRFFFEQQWRT